MGHMWPPVKTQSLSTQGEVSAVLFGLGYCLDQLGDSVLIESVWLFVPGQPSPSLCFSYHSGAQGSGSRHGQEERKPSTRKPQQSGPFGEGTTRLTTPTP